MPDEHVGADEWDEFVTTWTPLLRAYLRRLHCGSGVIQSLINDILAEAYVIARRNRAAGVESVARATAREVSTSWKRSARENARLKPLTTTLEMASVQSLAGDRERLWDWLSGLLDQLPIRQRAAIERHLDGVSDAVIATEIGSGVASVRVLRHRGMNTLRRLAPVRPDDWES